MKNQKLLDHLKTIFSFSFNECKWREYALQNQIPVTRNTFKIIIFFSCILLMFSEKSIQNISVIVLTYSLLLIVTKKETIRLMKFFIMIVACGMPIFRLFLVGTESILYSHVSSVFTPIMVLLFSGCYISTTVSFVYVFIVGRYASDYLMQEFIQSPASFERMFTFYINNSHFLQFLSWVFLTLIFYNKQALLAQLWYKQKETENLFNEVQKKNEELERVDQSKNKFFLSLSHEFRNPINAALGNLELAGEKIYDHITQKYINNASTSIGLLLHLVSNLLDTHKIEGGSLEWNPLLQDSRKLFDKVWKISKNLLDKHNLIGDFYIHKKIPKQISTDSHYLIQTLLNVIFNAIKYTQKGGVMVVLSWVDQTEYSEEDDMKPTKAFYSRFLDSISQKVQLSPSSISLKHISLSLSTQPNSQTDDSFGATECDIPKEYPTVSEQNLLKDKLLKRSSVQSIEEFRHLRKHYEMMTNRYDAASFISEKDWTFEDNCSEGGYLKIEVFDSGRGIDDHLKNAIFQKYSSTSLEGEDRLGLGLGLFLTKRMVESRGGKITAYSDKDEGSQFVVLIPVDTFVAHCSLKSSRLTTMCSETSLPQLSAFVVDDDKYNREISSVFLSKVGVQVKGEAVNGQEAVEVVTSKPSDYCDFVLMDLEMPVMNGKEAVKRIRQYEAQHQRVPTKIVIATGNVDLETYNECMDPEGEIKADLFYRKPLRKRDFEEIAEIIQKERAQQSTCVVIKGDNLMLDFVKTALNKHKVHVMSAKTVEEAKMLIKEHQTTLRWVLTDLSLPENQLKNLVSTVQDKTQVIGFSENLSFQQKMACEKLKIEKMLSSPLNPDEFHIVLDLH